VSKDEFAELEAAEKQKAEAAAKESGAAGVRRQMDEDELM